MEPVESQAYLVRGRAARSEKAFRQQIHAGISLNEAPSRPTALLPPPLVLATLCLLQCNAVLLNK